MEKFNCCKTCIFADHNYPLYSYEYECHRFPPTSAAGFNRYPMINATDWCGEHREKEVK